MCEPFEFATIKDRRARREYWCSECHRPIPIGTVYECLDGKWDGSMGTVRTCIECRDFRKLCYDTGVYESECGGIVYGGDFRETVLEAYPDGVIETLKREQIPDWWFESITRSINNYAARYGKTTRGGAA